MNEPIPKVNFKELKITQKFFSRSDGYVVFPEIRLSGKWLHELGFKCGENVTLKLSDGEIIITTTL